MRFIFVGGGRSGIRSAEALGHALEAYLDDNRHLGDMFVDFAESYDQPGELFREKLTLLYEMSEKLGNVISVAKGSDINMADMWQNLGESYWAEAERMLMSRQIPKPRRKKSNSRRKSL